MPVPYQKHGRRHAADGEDPIPGGGIQFDTYPQDGGYLYIETGDGTDSPNQYAFQVKDTGTTANDGVQITSARLVDIGTLGNDLYLYTTGGNDLYVESYDTGYIYIGTDETTTVTIGASDCSIDIDGDTVSIDANAGNLNLNASGAGNDVMMKLSGTGAGDRFQIRDSSNNVLLEVRGDGTFHIETGAAWVADL